MAYACGKYRMGCGLHISFLSLFKIISEMSTINKFLSFSRRPTRVVSLGSLKIGGAESICIQSMLTSNTSDLPRVLEEITTLAAARCRLIRITVPNQRAVESLPAIRQGMEERGIEIPLVADIHFNPKLAIDSCEFVEKVRINPGNYADRKRFEIREYSEAQYQEELERIEASLLPLIANLKKYSRAVRIGTNHGSLSDRLLNRYGDTPQGMAESALEFVRIFRKHHFNDIILSMKSSIPSVMIQAYRLLVVRMEQEGMDYPLHLGVTEAGNGLDARIKSAIGIGSLLMDGIGDTIRVSLTEPAENEIPAAQSILQGLTCFRKESPAWQNIVYETPISISKRATQPVVFKQKNDECFTSLQSFQAVTVGGEAPFAFLGISSGAIKNQESAFFDKVLSMPPGGRTATSDILLFEALPSSWREKNSIVEREIPPVILMEDQQIGENDFSGKLGLLRRQNEAKLLLVQGFQPLLAVRFLVQLLQNWRLDWPVGIIASDGDDSRRWSGLAAQVGSLIVDGLVDCLVCPTIKTGKPIFRFCQTLLQATRARLFKADFISCPSCGRTFFDLQTTTDAIRACTQHLKGIKIGVMGCVVNGPGEMADADFGYIGAGEGKINLYRKQECVARNIPQNQAVEHLIELIKADGRWVAPPGELLNEQ